MTQDSAAQATLGPRRIGIDARKLGDFGVGAALWNLIVHLRRLDPDSRYILLHQTPPPADAPPGLEWVWDGAPKYSLREQASLPWHAWRQRLDLLHCPHYVVPLARVCPLVVTIHDIIHVALGHLWPRPAREYARFMIRRAVVGARRVITDTEGSRRDLIERVGADPAKLVVIPIAAGGQYRRIADPARLADLRRRYGIDRPYLLSVGNARMAHKNLVTLFRAFRLARERGLDLALVVTGGLPPDALRRDWAAAAGDALAHVRFAGYVPGADLPALYSAAEAFVWPSLYEGFGLPPLEAMACGTPVISSRASVMPEVLGDAPLYVEPLAAEDYAEAIGRVLTDPALRADLARRGLARAARYSWEDSARRTLAVYREVLEEGH
jgi:glycosyltransferase involved in cell wall biosynthesis